MHAAFSPYNVIAIPRKTPRMWNRPYIPRQPSADVTPIDFAAFAPSLDLGGSVRVLSRDAGDGASTCLWTVPAGWRHPGGYRLAGAEHLFVLEGDIQIGPNRFRPGCYGYRSPGYMHEPRASEGGAVILASWDRALMPGGQADGPVGDGKVFVDTAAMPAMPTPVAGPPTGIVVKILNHEPATGGMSMLITIPPGWTEDRAEHHDCVEESFKVAGDISIVEDGKPHTLAAGDYFFRPPRIKHGPMKTAHGTTSLIRFSAAVVNHYGPIEP